MRKSLVISMLATMPLAATTALAQVAPKGTGFKAEYLAELSVAEDHLVRLAEAIPADKYTCALPLMCARSAKCFCT